MWAHLSESWWIRNLNWNPFLIFSFSVPRSSYLCIFHFVERKSERNLNIQNHMLHHDIRFNTHLCTHSWQLDTISRTFNFIWKNTRWHNACFMFHLHPDSIYAYRFEHCAYCFWWVFNHNNDANSKGSKNIKISS